MPESHSTRLIAAPQVEVWDVVSDPDHLPRWWPGVARMEGVHDDRFTQVMHTRRGRPVRIDFRVAAFDRPWSCLWAQEIAGTPFARVLRECTIELRLEPAEGGTLVTLTQRQRLRGYSWTGGWMLRRATGARLAEALAGLARAFG
ncbi:MAG: SRPBCC family protein [Solirubrobacteraceae bacterium]